MNYMFKFLFWKDPKIAWGSGSTKPNSPLPDVDNFEYYDWQSHKQLDIAV